MARFQHHFALKIASQHFAIRTPTTLLPPMQRGFSAMFGRTVRSSSQRTTKTTTSARFNSSSSRSTTTDSATSSSRTTSSSSSSSTTTSGRSSTNSNHSNNNTTTTRSSQQQQQQQQSNRNQQHQKTDKTKTKFNSSSIGSQVGPRAAAMLSRYGKIGSLGMLSADMYLLTSISHSVEDDT